MGANSAIAWCTDTWNFWAGCEPVGPECVNCYAEKWLARAWGTLVKAHPELPLDPEHQWGSRLPRIPLSEHSQNSPLRWMTKPMVCPACGEAQPDKGFKCLTCDIAYPRRRVVFVNSLSDVFDPKAPDAWRDQLFRIAEFCDNLRFLFLTKRETKMAAYLEARYRRRIPAHFAFGVTAGVEASLYRLDVLRTIPAKRFVSMEPMLEPIPAAALNLTGINQIIVGGESNAKRPARPFDLAWALDVMKVATAHDCRFFFKQTGDAPAFYGKPYPKKTRAGTEPQEWPESLRFQEPLWETV